MNKRLVVLSLVLLSMIMLVSIPSAFAQVDDDVEKKFWEKAISIGNLEFLTGEADAESKVIGFVRLLLAIAMGFLFYALASAFRNYIPEKVGIGIAVVLAILTVIGIPPEIIALIISTYSAAASFILLGVVLGPLIYFIFFTPTHGRAMAGLKLFVLAVAAFLFGSINYFLKELKVITGEETWLLFIAWAETFAVWVFIVFIIMGLYLLFMLFAARPPTEEELQRGATAGGRAAVWGAGKGAELAKSLGGKVAKRFRRLDTSTLNEYIKEQEELKHLKSLVPLVENLDKLFDDIVKKGDIEKDHWKDPVTKSLNELKSETNKAFRTFDKLKRNTGRQRKEANKFIDLLKNEGLVDASEVTALEGLLNDILAKHEETYNQIVDFKNRSLPYLNSFFDKVNDAVKGKAAGAPVDLTEKIDLGGSVGKVTIRKVISDHIRATSLRSSISSTGSLTRAIESEKEAIDDLRGFIAEIKRHWRK